MKHIGKWWKGYQDQCPRCGQWSAEKLRIHFYCWECNYFPEHDEGLAQQRDIEYRNEHTVKNEPNFKITYGGIL